MKRRLMIPLFLCLIIILSSCNAYGHTEPIVPSPLLAPPGGPSYSREAVPSELSPSPNPPPSQPPENIIDWTKWYKSKEKGIKVPILMYHNLLKGASQGDGLNVSEAVFEDQVLCLKSYGYNGITFEDLYKHYMEGAQLPSNPIIITFDDGYKSNYTIGYPILKKYGMKACIFMIADAIGSPNYMSTDELREVTASGIIEIQGHSMTHDDSLSTMEKSRLRKELKDSKAKLEEILGKTVNVFAYPYGKYSQSLMDELMAEGYIFSVTTEYGCASKKANPFLLPRIRAGGSDSGMVLKKRIEGLTGRKTPYNEKSY